MTDVTVYSMPTCPVCKGVKAYLEERGVAYRDVDVSGSAEAFDELRRAAPEARSAPVLVIGKTVLLGFDPRRIEAALAEADA
jgi:glutaredoxin 3